MLPDSRKLNHANVMTLLLVLFLLWLGTLEQLRVKEQMPTNYTFPFPSIALPCPHTAGCLLLELPHHQILCTLLQPRRPELGACNYKTYISGTPTQRRIAELQT